MQKLIIRHWYAWTINLAVMCSELIIWHWYAGTDKLALLIIRHWCAETRYSKNSGTDVQESIIWHWCAGISDTDVQTLQWWRCNNKQAPMCRDLWADNGKLALIIRHWWESTHKQALISSMHWGTDKQALISRHWWSRYTMCRYWWTGNDEQVGLCPSCGNFLTMVTKPIKECWAAAHGHACCPTGEYCLGH